MTNRASVFPPLKSQAEFIAAGRDAPAAPVAPATPRPAGAGLKRVGMAAGGLAAGLVATGMAWAGF